MAVSFRAGSLRKRITIQQRAVAQDSYGGQSECWSDLATVWAEIRPLSGRELLAAQAVQSEVSHTITVRWNPMFSDPKAVSAMRALYGGRIFNIGASMNIDENNRVIELTATEGLNNG